MWRIIRTLYYKYFNSCSFSYFYFFCETTTKTTLLCKYSLRF